MAEEEKLTVTEIRVYHRHMMALGYCNRQLRARMVGAGVAWPDFLAHGVTAGWLRSTGNAMAIAAADLAEREWRMADES